MSSGQEYDINDCQRKDMLPKGHESQVHDSGMFSNRECTVMRVCCMEDY